MLINFFDEFNHYIGALIVTYVVPLTKLLGCMLKEYLVILATSFYERFYERNLYK